MSEYGGNREPTEKEIERCSPKLEELFKSQEWSGIIYIGNVAKQFQTKLPSVSILHPASIARMEYQMTSIKEQAHILTKFLHAQLSNLQREANSS